MKATNILVYLACFVALATAQVFIQASFEQLCVSYRYTITWSTDTFTNVNYTVDSADLMGALAEYTIPADETVGTFSRLNYLLPESGVTYRMSLINNDNDNSLVTNTFTAEPCTNLPTYGLPNASQAVLVLDHYRTEVAYNPSARVYRHPELEKLAQLMSVDEQTTNIGQFIGQINYPNILYLTQFKIPNTNADAGSLIQIILDLKDAGTEAIKNTTWREVGFNYNNEIKLWQVILGTRQAACGNNVLDLTEECDDGNRDDFDGCSSTCRIEEGWSCEEGPLIQGTPCTTTPSYVPGAPQSGPSAGPSGNSPSGTAPDGSSNTPSGSNNPATNNPNSSPESSVTSASNKIQVISALFGIAGIVTLF